VPDRSGKGSLSVVGIGIRPGLHLTQETRVRIQRADDVLYLLAEIGPTGWIHALNASAESLAPLYRPDREQGEVYEELVESALTRVRRGRNVCMVTYGNPAVFDDSSLEAIRRARAEGFRARLLPAVSSLDCLFADLGLDPGKNGLQLHDATDFLIFRRTPDLSVPLVLWQISVIGQTRTTGIVNRGGLRLLAERLGELYGGGHGVVVYEASPFPVGPPMIERSSVNNLASAEVTGLSSLYVPAASNSTPDPAVRDRLSNLTA